jgi:hypothetical protein
MAQALAGNRHQIQGGKVMCQYCNFGTRGKFKGRTPDFLILQDRFAVKIEKDEPYVGDYGLTVSDNEDECEFTVAIKYCPMCGRKLTEA